MASIKDVASVLETFASKGLQEHYDNCGLIIGDNNKTVTGVMLCIDVTQAVIDEAIDSGCNMIVSHHPLIFNGIKSLTGKTYIEKCIISAIKNDIAIYAAHTNFDNAKYGVSYRMAWKLGLKNISVLSPRKDALVKLVTYVPYTHFEKVRSVLANSGAGMIGDYDSCSFSHSGQGAFRALKGANPFVGEHDKLHFEEENRIEVIVPKYRVSEIVRKMIEAHPYEQPAYDIIPLLNTSDDAGLGCIGELETQMTETEVLTRIKSVFETNVIKHSVLRGEYVRKIALCGGSGSEFINTAIASGAQMYISADISYHNFFSAENQIVIADIGHFESERFTKEIFYEQLTENFTNFAVRMAKSDINPVYCF